MDQYKTTGFVFRGIWPSKTIDGKQLCEYGHLTNTVEIIELVKKFSLQLHASEIWGMFIPFNSIS